MFKRDREYGCCSLKTAFRRSQRISVLHSNRFRGLSHNGAFTGHVRSFLTSRKGTEISEIRVRNFNAFFVSCLELRFLIQWRYREMTRIHGRRKRIAQKSGSLSTLCPCFPMHANYLRSSHQFLQIKIEVFRYCNLPHIYWEQNVRLGKYVLHRLRKLLKAAFRVHFNVLWREVIDYFSGLSFQKALLSSAKERAGNKHVRESSSWYFPRLQERRILTTSKTPTNEPPSQNAVWYHLKRDIK